MRPHLAELDVTGLAVETGRRVFHAMRAVRALNPAVGIVVSGKMTDAIGAAAVDVFRYAQSGALAYSGGRGSPQGMAVGILALGRLLLTAPVDAREPPADAGTAEGVAASMAPVRGLLSGARQDGVRVALGCAAVRWTIGDGGPVTVPELAAMAGVTPGYVRQEVGGGRIALLRATREARNRVAAREARRWLALRGVPGFGAPP